MLLWLTFRRPMRWRNGLRWSCWRSAASARRSSAAASLLSRKLLSLSLSRSTRRASHWPSATAPMTSAWSKVWRHCDGRSSYPVVILKVSRDLEWRQSITTSALSSNDVSKIAVSLRHCDYWVVGYEHEWRQCVMKSTEFNLIVSISLCTCMAASSKS